jgi:putative Mg2+ transporter-C (MgtC) family protein
MIMSAYAFADSMLGSYDPNRIAAQVVSGIGFLGAGVIFVRNNLVNGLTTAAGIWATAGVGLALGAGLYIIGISCAVLIIVMQMLMHSISYFAKVPSLGLLKLTIVQRPGAIKEMEKFLSDEKVDVASVKVHKNKKEEIKLEFEVVYPPGFDRVKLLAKLAEEDCVVTISE